MILLMVLIPIITASLVTFVVLAYKEISRTRKTAAMHEEESLKRHLENNLKLENIDTKVTDIKNYIVDKINLQPEKLEPANVTFDSKNLFDNWFESILDKIGVKKYMSFPNKEESYNKLVVFAINLDEINIVNYLVILNCNDESILIRSYAIGIKPNNEDMELFVYRLNRPNPFGNVFLDDHKDMKVINIDHMLPFVYYNENVVLRTLNTINSMHNRIIKGLNTKQINSYPISISDYLP